MRTTRLPTIRALAIRCQYQWGESPQINKFEQVSSDCHQMSLAGGPISDIFWLGGGSDVRVRAEGVMGPMSDVPLGGGQGQEGGELYSEIQCIMVNGHMGTSYKQTDSHK